jgi:hypothetical protein
MAELDRRAHRREEFVLQRPVKMAVAISRTETSYVGSFSTLTEIRG